MHKIIIDGKDVELSDDSYNSLKKFFTEEKPKRWRAKHDHDYKYINFKNGINVDSENGHDVDNKRHEAGNYFNPETDDAEMEVLRRESRVDVHRPEYGEIYYYWSFFLNTVSSQYWNNYTMDFMNCHNGNCFPDTPEGEKQCEEWGKTKAKAFK